MRVPGRRAAHLAMAILLVIGSFSLMPGARAFATCRPAVGDEGVAEVTVCLGDGPILRCHVIGFDGDPCQDDPWDLAPCVTVAVTVERPSEAGEGTIQVPYRDGNCDNGSSDVSLSWNVTAFAGHGTANFTFDAQDAQSQLPHVIFSQSVRPRALSPLTRLLQGSMALPAPRTAASPLPPLPPVVVSIAFDAAWGGDCEDVHGKMSASVNGANANAAAPAGFFRDLCRLSTAPGPAGLALGVLQAVVALGRASVPDIPLPSFARVVDALAALAPPLDARPVEPPTPPVPHPENATVPGASSSPAPAGGGDRAAGNATLSIFDAADLIAERHDAILETPLGSAEAQGGWGLPAPAFFPTDIRAWGDAAAPGAPVAADHGPAPPAPRSSSATGQPSDARTPAGGGLGNAQGHARSLSPQGSAPVAAPTALATVVAGAAVAGTVLLLAALALYQRVTRAAALRHPARESLLRACRDAGRGATAGELAAATGLPRKTAEYHLRYLARAGHLRMDKEREGPARFALHSVPRHEPAALPLDETILARVCARPGALASEIAEELGVSRFRVDARVKDLLMAGRVTCRVERRRRRVYPA